MVFHNYYWLIIVFVYLVFALIFHLYVRIYLSKKNGDKKLKIRFRKPKKARKDMTAIEENQSYVKSLLRKTNREGIEKLIKYLDTTDYYQAPASTRYHLNTKGGLVMHSLNMYDALDLLNRHYGEPLSHDSVIIISLLHDLCKVGIYHQTIKDGEKIYERKDPMPIGHGDKSLYIISHYIPLKPEEELLIRWHMGPYDPSFDRNRKAIKAIFPYPKLAYLADDIAASIADEMME